MGRRVIGGRYALEIPEPARPGCAVWRARDATTGGAVVVVLLDEHPAAATTLVALAAARHPSLPVVIDHGEDEAARFVVVPPRGGETARTRFATRPSVAEVADLGAVLADALAALHEAGLAQGGLDLAAIAVDADGRPRLEDLATGGLARPADQPDDDVRALAAVLRELLGVPDGATPLEVDGMPTRLAGLLQSMASIAPPTAAEARDVLRSIAHAADGGLVLAAPPGGAALAAAGDGGGRRGLKVLVAALAVLVVALGAIVVAEVVDRRDAASRAAATSLPGPIASASAVEGGSSSDAATVAPATTAAEPVGPATGVQRLAIASVQPVDPGGDGHESDADAKRVVDGSPGTRWSTEVYKPGAIARKGGLGLVLHLAAPARVRRIVLRTAPVGATIAIYGARGAPPAATPPSGWLALAPAQRLAAPRAVLRCAGGGRLTDVLVWITGLPPVGGGEQLEIAEIAVLGVPAGA